MKTELDMNEFVRVLNEAFEIDPAAIFSLVQTNRVPCNYPLANHPTIIIDSPKAINGDSGDSFHDHPTLGFLGLLNGLLHSAGYEKSIAAKWTTDDAPRMLGFCIVDKQ